MIIGVMADSHDNLPMIRRAVELFRDEGAGCLIHAGDFVAPFAVKEVLKFDGRIEACFGNNDGEQAGIRKRLPQVAEPPRAFSIGGQRILLVHDRARATDDVLRCADVFIFAHDHEPKIQRVSEDGRDRLDVNPGETGGWLSGRSTVAILDTDGPTARIVEL